jgi:hypothetical protein
MRNLSMNLKEKANAVVTGLILHVSTIQHPLSASYTDWLERFTACAAGRSVKKWPPNIPL